VLNLAQLNFNNKGEGKMKNKILTAAISSWLLITSVNAADFSKAHEFSSGDVLSADMMNELFSQLENINKTLTSGDLAGTWGLTQISCAGGAPDACTENNNPPSVPGSEASVDGLTWSRTDTVTMTDNGDDTYSWDQVLYSSFLCGGYGDEAGLGRFSIMHGTALFKDETGGTNVPDGSNGICPFNVKRVSDTRIQLSSIFNASFNIILLDKQSVPPLSPSAFAISTSGLVNTLTWTDNSDNEVNFDIYKKSAADGNWIMIDEGAGLTVVANVTTYTDTVSIAGDYWYRIKSKNTDGYSIGSKVVKVSNIE